MVHLGSGQLGQASEIDQAMLTRLHASTVVDPVQIDALLSRAQSESVFLSGRRTVRGDAERATIKGIDAGSLLLDCEHIASDVGGNLFLSFAFDGRSFFFSVPIVGVAASRVRTAKPSVLYVAERRDRKRLSVGMSRGVPSRVVIEEASAAWAAEGEVRDFSPVGIYVESPANEHSVTGSRIRVRYVDGALAGAERWGLIRHAENAERSGWKRLGIATSEVPFSEPIQIETRTSVSGGTGLRRAQQGLRLLSAGAAAASRRLLGRTAVSRSSSDVAVVDYSNDRGEQIRGIIDRWGAERSATAVLIPPAWGRTKETLLPLAATIVETFRRAGEPVSVLRFDGTRRRGESFKERGFEKPGTEHIPFLFSHAIDDILASARFLAESPAIAASRVILVTFSAASIEGRRALLLDKDRRLAGWVSVVGTPDLQSGLRTVSGGIDYVAGVEQELSFGTQEIMGVAASIDVLIAEALSLKLAFLEDARRDMSEIRVPVTWIHGANDAWLDLERVREVMGSGDVTKRRLIEVPTGHQLRSSREALEVFMLVSEQAAEMALGRRVEGSLPNLRALELRRAQERQRLSRSNHDIRGFWRDYLLGRDRTLGIELMNATQAYEDLMGAQIRGLGLEAGSVVADIGAGTGSLPLALMDWADCPKNLVVDEIDYVPEAFDRARQRLLGRDSRKMSIRFVECDIEDDGELASVLSPGRYDAVLLSLVLSYVREPLSLLKRVAGAMRPGAKLVVSSLRPDADVSRIYLQSVDELRAGRARTILGVEAERTLSESVRTFLNDMARVLDFEEQGIFRFVDLGELTELVASAGFSQIETSRSFGDPPQAIVLSARKAGN